MAWILLIGGFIGWYKTRYAWSSDILKRPLNSLPLRMVNLLLLGVGFLGVVLLFD